VHTHAAGLNTIVAHVIRSASHLPVISHSMLLARFARMPRLTCPSCQAQFASSTLWRTYSFTSRRYATEKEILCPACRCELMVRFRNVWTLCGIVCGAIALTAYAVGFRGMALVALPAVALRLGHFLIIDLSVRLFPPDVEMCGDFRKILYARDQEHPAPPPQPVIACKPAPDGGSAGA